MEALKTCCCPPNPLPLPSRYEDTIVAPVLSASIPAGGRLADRPYTHKAKVASLSVLSFSPYLSPLLVAQGMSPDLPDRSHLQAFASRWLAFRDWVPMSYVMYCKHSSFEDSAVICMMAF
jgi:hypothetical protein